MKLKAFSILFFLVFQLSSAQTKLSGVVVDEITGKPIPDVEIYNKNEAKSEFARADGTFSIYTIKADTDFVFIVKGFEFLETTLQVDVSNTIKLKPLSEQLSEVIINQQREKIFGIKNLKEVEGTAIYAGKKSEVILVDQLVSNKASGNPRQAYAQVAGLNIYETDDAGLQLNIGGRGLDPNRSSNFNTRQNGYDISADVLGYPESYYTPPLEVIDEIQIVRGAASLQYGTQFGGLVNFKLKKPNPTKEFELITRQGGGSFGLINSFTSLSGTVGKASYYTYFQYKQGDGFRPNSNFDSRNVYANLGYQFSDKTKLTFESTYLNYLAQQAGGLSDAQFLENPVFSNRTRNFFAVDWVLLNLKLEHEINSKTKASLNIFHLDAYRKALGFRDDRATEVEELALARELITDDFVNWGAEARLLTNYNLLNRNSIFLLGCKYYQSDNFSRQGFGSNGIDADFSFYDDDFLGQEGAFSQHSFPNLNISLFSENIFKLSNTFSVTPGVRFEYIKTQADGFYYNRIIDFAGNPRETILNEDDRVNERSFLLLGLGLSYKPSARFEAFANFSQNYRSVTFTDIRIDNPSLLIDENITDETGYTGDIGIRGKINEVLRYDVSGFWLFYDNRIGPREITEEEIDAGFFELADRLKQYRTNVGQANIAGLESLITFNASNTFLPDKNQFHWQHFVNTAYTYSEYTKAKTDKILGNRVEFIPEINIKTGLELGYKNLKSSLQYTYISEQFTDVDNNILNVASQSGTIGEIPAYEVMDLSLEYTYKNWKLETGVNNLLDESYFTRRATGYPGPGIIPSNPRNYYVVLQLKL